CSISACSFPCRHQPQEAMSQVMIISGCDNDGKLNFSGWRDNLIIATQLQKQMAEDYKGLARPLYFAPFRYNMDLTPNSLLIEFGTDVNTLEEAKYSGKLVGKSLVKTLEKYVVK
ncbi:MAG: stage II sporulation protein P, partial [Acutalibacteraceae bacterium]